MADDNIVSIRITGAVDASLTASTAEAQSSLADLAASGVAAAGSLDRELLANANATAQAKLGIRKDLSARLAELDRADAASETALARKGAEDAITTARESGQAIISADQGTAEQRKDAVNKLWKDLVAGERLTAGEIESVNRDRTKQLSDIDKRAAEDARAIERNDIETSVQLQKIGLNEKKAMLDEEVATGKITEEQKVALLEEYAKESAATDIKVLNDAINSGKLTVVEANADKNEILVITCGTRMRCGKKFAELKSFPQRLLLNS